MRWPAGDPPEGLEPLPAHGYIGLRGMSNLGQTCFMNGICQALCHVPLFRNYFLSECHCPAVCRTARRQRPGDRTCVACEVDAMVNALFNGEREALVPHRFLYTFWKQGMQSSDSLDGGSGDTLAGYEQQDAHEFLGALLDTLKSHDRSTTRSPEEPGIVEICFNGVLCSDVRCNACLTVSSTKECFTELSLEIDEGITGDRSCPTSLQQCLAGFTRQEVLAERVHCGQCGRHQECTKQLSLQELPRVLVLHLKRFNHNRAAKQKVKKIENFVAFPLENLNMRPFMSPSLLKLQPNMGSADGMYDLAAVLEHRGDNTCQTGHYITHLRHEWPRRDDEHSDWFLFDDSCVYHSTSEEVGRAQAYLLFYVAQQLKYAA